jgi:acylphosphatase
MPDKDKNVRVRVIVEGRVQGVFFRYSTCEQAEKLGVNGWVLNRPNGDVELLVEGMKDAVDSLIGWCHHGPPGARVTNVRITYELYAGEFKSFTVRHSASMRW